MEYELYHHGILGMKWGVRRYQNKDGTWTAAGKKRYSDEDNAPSNKTSKFKEKVKKTAGKVATNYVNSLVKQNAQREIISNAERKKIEVGNREVLKQKKFKDAMKTHFFGSPELSAKRQRIEAEKYRKLADHALNRFQKADYLQKADNAEYMAQYYDKRSKMTKGERVKEFLTEKELRKTPYATYNLKGERTGTITVGEQRVREARSKLVTDLVFDIGYELYKEHRSSTGHRPTVEERVNKSDQVGYRPTADEAVKKKRPTM